MTSRADIQVDGRTADVLYDIFFAGAVGGSIVALYFLVVDLIGGQALFTASLIGSVLFEGAPASPDLPLRFDLVAMQALLHFATFAAVGAAVAWLEQRLRLHAKHPFTAMLIIAAVTNVVFVGGALLWLPGVLSVLGLGHVILANVLAAGGMTFALDYGHKGAVADRAPS